MIPLHKDLFFATGRTTRLRFCIAFVILALSVWLQGIAISTIGAESLTGFYVGLFWLCLNLYVAYVVYVCRLHDMNISAGLFFATLFMTLFVVAITIWVGGLNGYFEEIMANPKIADDPEANKALVEDYQAELAENVWWARWVNLIPLGALTLFCALMPGKPEDNRYGDAPRGQV